MFLVVASVLSGTNPTLFFLGLPKASGTRARVVVFTQGSESTIVASEGAVHEFPVNALAKDKLVDTNGKANNYLLLFADLTLKHALVFTNPPDRLVLHVVQFRPYPFLRLAACFSGLVHLPRPPYLTWKRRWTVAVCHRTGAAAVATWRVNLPRVACVDPSPLCTKCYMQTVPVQVATILCAKTGSSLTRKGV